MPSVADPDRARMLDEQDPLASFRHRFVITDPDLIYLDGNSLGRLPKQSLELSRELVAEQWGGRLIRGWNEAWMDLPQRVGGKIARLIGARPDEVIVADSTSVNLFKLVLAALTARPGRTKVVTDDLNFPTDVYILQSAVSLAGPGRRLEILPSPDGVHGPVEALREAIDEDTALVALCHTAFKTAFVYDMPSVTGLAHSRGALMLWDLCHSVGAMPLTLAEIGVDLAVGCTYKYLNGGPGAPAFLYVRREIQPELHNPIAGWMGRDEPFTFSLEYRPHAGIRRFLTGTPPVLSLALIEPGVDLLLEAGLERVRQKSVRQTEYLISLWDELLAPLGYTLNCPRQAARRGSHVALGHAEAWRINQALISEMNVIPDFRPPDTIRLGVCPLYSTCEEIYRAALALKVVVEERRYERYPGDRAGVA